MLRWAAVCPAAWVVWAWTCNFGPGLNYRAARASSGARRLPKEKTRIGNDAGFFMSLRNVLLAYCSGYTLVQPLGDCLAAVGRRRTLSGIRPAWFSITAAIFCQANRGLRACGWVVCSQSALSRLCVCLRSYRQNKKRYLCVRQSEKLLDGLAESSGQPAAIQRVSRSTISPQIRIRKSLNRRWRTRERCGPGWVGGTASMRVRTS